MHTSRLKTWLRNLSAPTSIVLSITTKLLLLAVVIGALLRVALLFHPLTSLAGITALQMLGVFAIGAVNDLCTATLMLLPLLLLLFSTGRWKFGTPQRYGFIAIIVAAYLWLMFGANVIYEFNRPLLRILKCTSLYWLAVFCLRAFVPKVRNGWTRFWVCFTVWLYVLVMVFNAVGEWLFWNEFGVRYNFIAVDYLIYTSEVIGNIWESYPVGWVGAGIALVATAITWLLFHHQLRHAATVSQPGWRAKAFGIYVVAAVVAAPLLWLTHQPRNVANKYVSELEASGAYTFYKAFLSNELSYSSFYTTLSQEEVDQNISAIYSGRNAAAAAHPDTLPEKNYNIVLITMESMSAEYMAHFGGKNNLTPCLDSLYDASLAFTRLFANGNRTVRGLEALTLCRPPAPGESIIKRPDNSGYPSAADQLDAHGYRKIFFYGGDSYFDNMESFFSGLGYDICDKKAFTPREVEFETVWGICDEDVFTKMITVLDQASEAGQPFIAHMMTTSNHRPYTYPEGKISIPPTKKSRSGGVMYSDYAVGQFFEKAKKAQWFPRTIFVLVADHCASSAGSVDIPLESYHIPALIYAPEIIEPRTIGTVCSQIDIMPTVFGLMGWKPDTALYGVDILSPAYEPRAFVATYQDMGLLQSDTLTVLSPGSKLRQYAVTPTPDNPLAITEVTPNPAGPAARAAVTFYQSSSQK